MKLSSTILIYISIFAIVLGYYLFGYVLIRDEFLTYLFGALIFAFIIVYILQAEIDWWWWQRRPPSMPAPLERQMATTVPFYRGLNPVERKRFRDRVMLWMKAKDFSVKILDDFPEEVKCLLAAYGVQLTFGIDKYLLQPYERIVMYPHPFPSPNHQYLHNSESNAEQDERGVMIFNATYLVPGMNHSVQYYNLALHEFAGIFMRLYPDYDYPEFSEEKIQILEMIREAKIEAIKEVVGLKDIDIRQIAIEHFFVQPIRFQDLLPEEYEQLSQIFNLNPVNYERPVINLDKIGVNPLKGE